MHGLNSSHHQGSPFLNKYCIVSVPRQTGGHHDTSRDTAGGQTSLSALIGPGPAQLASHPGNYSGL